MDKWGKSRRDLIWLLGLQPERDMLSLSANTEPVKLPVLTQAEKATMEYRATGLSTGPHPMTFYRQRLHWRGILSSTQLNQHPAEQWVWVAGQIVVIQSPPTAKGVVFITLRDELGFINLIVMPKVYVRFRRIIQGVSLLLAKGKVERQGKVTNLIVERCVALNEQTLSPIL
jgi:error-prone DNA polymerase